MPQREDVASGTNLKTALDVIMGETGKAVIECGGFVVTVFDHVRFPWYDVS